MSKTFVGEPLVGSRKLGGDKPLPYKRYFLDSMNRNLFCHPDSERSEEEGPGFFAELILSEIRSLS